MKPLFKTNHSTTYNGKEENPVFNDKALEEAKNIQPDKKGLKKMYQNMRKDKFVKSLQKQIKGDKILLRGDAFNPLPSSREIREEKYENRKKMGNAKQRYFHH